MVYRPQKWSSGQILRYSYVFIEDKHVLVASKIETEICVNDYETNGNSKLHLDSFGHL